MGQKGKNFDFECNLDKFIVCRGVTEKSTNNFA
jgi:hypothetical protein